jgi:CDP-glycerol glycerophosphotransferase
MVEDKRFSDYKFVWAFHDPQKYDIKNAIIIKTDTLNYFIKALKEMGANSRFYIEKVFDKKKVVEITLNTLFSN